MSKFIMVPRKVAEYHDGFNDISLDLLKNFEMKKDPQTGLLTNVPSLLFNWSFECEYMLSVDIRGMNNGILIIFIDDCTYGTREVVRTIMPVLVHHVSVQL